MSAAPPSPPPSPSPPSHGVPSITDVIGRTPLVRLQHIGSGLAAPIYVKCEHMNPGGSVKDRIARAILFDAEARGVLSPGATLIEATAGNTGMGLALIAASRGYRLVCVMPEKMSQDKRDALAMLGAEVIVTRNAPPSSPDNFQVVARRLAEQNGWFLADQFENPANPAAHEQTTGPEIFEQTGGDIGAFVAGVGTGGTLTGVGRYLKRRDPAIRIVLADPAGSGLARWVERRELGPDAAYQVEGIGSSKVPGTFDADVVDAAETIPDEESFETTRRLLVEEGLFVGGSAGTAVAAAVRVAARGEIRRPVVALLPDGWDRYRSKPWMQALRERKDVR